MNDYKQGNYQDKISQSNETIAKSGCYLVCLSDIVEKEPPEVNAILTAHGCFNSGGYMDSACAAKTLGIEYNGKSSTFPDGYDYCICETNYYAPKAPQHFFIKYKSGQIIDPLGKSINYPVVSYRLWRGKESPMFDENYVKNIVDSTNDALAEMMSNYDNSQDKVSDFEEAKKGNTTILGQRLRIYLNAPECKYMLKSDNALQVSNAIAKTRKEDQEAVKGLIDPKDCPATTITCPTLQEQLKTFLDIK